VVIGGSSGVGKATAQALVRDGARVTAVARNAERLRSVEGATPLVGDATDPAFLERVLRDKPDLVVLTAGITTQMGPVDEMDWDTFSQAWNNDMKSAFYLCKLALTVPLAPGSTVVIVSSGAAVDGSPLSGGYAGAKRMQWLLAGYAQKLSDAKQLGIRTIAIVPRQLIVGTAIGMKASTAYAAKLGISQPEYMKRFEVPMDADKAAEGILQALDMTGNAFAVSGKGVQAL
jgi:NAD(P)-dependent dehydrogenase (short-subunit alcohol dehydrogenase family)